MEDKLVTLSFLKRYDAKKQPPIQYVDELPNDNIENGIYAIVHEESETKQITARFTDILSSYFTEESKGKWTINEGYTVKVGENEDAFKSAAYVSDKYFIYKNADYTEMFASSYLPETDYSFTIIEDISHTDYFAANAENKTFVKLANEAQVQQYFIRIEEKGRPNGVASLDVNGKVPVEQLPTEALIFKGYWKPSSGAYPADGTVNGEFYIVEEEGDFDNIHWNVNDWLIWDDTKWTRSQNHNDVNSVNGKKGVVEVYGDNTEIETPTETSDKRTIKKYIDDITVDGNTYTEGTQDFVSTAVLVASSTPPAELFDKFDKVWNIEPTQGDREVYSKDIKLVTDEVYQREVVKSVNGVTPDEDGNVDCWAVIEGEELPEELQNKVYNIGDKVYSKDIELETKEHWENNRAVQTIEEYPETPDDTVYIQRGSIDKWNLKQDEPGDTSITFLTDPDLETIDRSTFETLVVEVNGIKYDASKKETIELRDSEDKLFALAKLWDYTIEGEPTGPNPFALMLYTDTYQLVLAVPGVLKDGNVYEISSFSVNRNIKLFQVYPSTIDADGNIKNFTKSGFLFVNNVDKYPLNVSVETEDFIYDAAQMKVTKKNQGVLLRTLAPLTYSEEAIDKVWAKDVEVATKTDLNNKYEELKGDINITVNNIEPDEERNIQTTVSLTKSEYADLVERGADDPNVLYAVYDEASSVDIMNDFVVGENTTWSSSKIQSVITAATPNLIDDTATRTKTVWSSSKTNKMIEDKTEINDAVTSTDSTWSSTEINNKMVSREGALKQELANTYQPIGDYATSSDISDMLTKTEAGNTYATKSDISDMLTKTDASSTYQPKGDYATTGAISDMLTKTEAATTYEPKNTDIATKTWVGQQSFATTGAISDMETKTHASQTYQPLGNYVTTSQIYVSGGVLYINM